MGMKRSGRKSYDPRHCKQLGRKVRNFSPAVWNEHKKEIVYKGNVEKFQQNEELEAFLLATGNKVLVEASPTDRIWGIGLGKHHADALSPSKWRGENLLGFTLMKVRDFIRMDEEI